MNQTEDDLNELKRSVSYLDEDKPMTTQDDSNAYKPMTTQLRNCE